MSLELYQNMIDYITREVPPPELFKSMVCSEFWCGGMPYLSIAHYPDLNGTAVPGEPLELFVDGKQLKARGILFDTKLGNAVWKSLQKDENRTPDKEPIRISIAFLDLAHKHGENGKVWERKSLTSLCPECATNTGNKIYVDGYLVHLALTRVPVNPRTRMTVEKSMTKKIQTRKEDALSIVEDSNLVEEIDSNVLEAKSDILVEMSDAEEVLVEDAKTKKDDDESTAKDLEESDSSDDKGKDKRKEKYSNKSITSEDVIEIVRSTIKDLLVPPAPPAVSEKSALDVSVDKLYDSINSALKMEATYEQKLESINPVLAELGSAITLLVKGDTAKPDTVSNDGGLILEAVTSLTQTVKDLATEVATLKAQTLTTSNVTVNRVPAPRSIQPQIQAALTGQSSQVINPNSVKNIVRRSVSQGLPPVAG